MFSMYWNLINNEVKKENANNVKENQVVLDAGFFGNALLREEYKVFTQ